MQAQQGVTLWLALWRVARDLERMAHQDVAGLGLCLSDFAVLEALLHRGPQRVSAIAEMVMLTSGSMTTAVDRLENRGLVRRSAHEHDARVRVVELTDTGRTLIAPAYQAHAQTMETAFETLDDVERRAFLKSLLRIRHSTRHGEG